MPESSTTVRIQNLPRRHVAALKRKAKSLGMTPAAYISQLIREDLELDQKARRHSLAELAAPFRKALDGLSEDDLDRIVATARTRGHPQG